MVTRVYPALIPERELRPLLASAVRTADRAATDGQCAVCVSEPATMGDPDPLCRQQTCRERFYALPLGQRNRLRRSAGLLATP